MSNAMKGKQQQSNNPLLPIHLPDVSRDSASRAAITGKL